MKIHLIRSTMDLLRIIYIFMSACVVYVGTWRFHVIAKKQIVKKNINKYLVRNLSIAELDIREYEQ